jgi:hypothetical protein
MRRILITAVMLVALGGCGKTHDPGLPSAHGAQPSVASTGARPDEVGFAKCMRDHGINVPDPVPGGEWAPVRPDGTARDKWDAGLNACDSLLGDMPIQDGPTASELEQLRNFAGCMRQHGIEMTDPDHDGGITIGGRLKDVSRTELNADPQFQAAQNACKDKLPPGMDKGR